MIATHDPDIELLKPAGDVEHPELSIVVPALNEQLTISDFIDWCHQGLKEAGLSGEILIIDSGTDRTAEIALAKGARVLKTPRRGLGRAYQDSIPFIRGKYVLMGDCDCTYDFRNLKPFAEAFRQGYEFVMGSRFLGTIDPGAMPALHRYLGTPVTTAILNIIYGSRFSDIHCGMRGLTKEALIRMHLCSQSWEYASEMVLKSVRLKLRTIEVPIHFLKDREGRLSHHKRSGWLSPWKAAWINLRVMFVYGPDFFLLKPGILLFVLGLSFTLPLSLGPITFGIIEFSLYWMLLGVSLTILGLQSFYMGVLAQSTLDYSGNVTEKWMEIFEYDRSVFLSALIFATGFFFACVLVSRYVSEGFRLESLNHPSSYLAVTGLLLMILAFMNFAFTLLLHASRVAPNKRLVHD